ncbi:MAG: DNA-3-methyladenine glycosylase I [Proteobacteria bacterium]|nr:DNA-3-methyladenine glycosylase I [Pseudomonadota bacterium]
MSVEVERCPWVDLSKPDYVQYHDAEWGVPVTDDTTLFEFITLESAQAGLSWYTVLKKRDAYRRAFSNFDVNKVARFNTRSAERLMNDAGIIRNRLKIDAAINNAQRFIETQQEFGSFSKYLWRFVDGKPIVNELRDKKDFKATTELSNSVAKDLKKRGFKFLGSTTIYAHLQATGLVNDHTMNCFRRQEILDAYAR